MQPVGTDTETEGLRVDSVSKSFFGTCVLDRVSLAIPAGTTHALLGHNGSGKSTLIKILSGFYTPDEGSGPIYVGGAPLTPGDAGSARELGLAFVHQALGLVPPLSVLENLRLGKSWNTNRAAKINWKRERRWARETLAQFDVHVDPDREVRSLSLLEQTEIAIVRAFADDYEMRVLVLDEATAALTDKEVQKLFATLSVIKARGIATLYVSHQLEEIHQVADDVTILREGQTEGSGPIVEFPTERLVRMISGGRRTEAQLINSSALSDSTGSLAVGDGAPALRISHLTTRELVDFNFACAPGEIVGVAGLLGSGVTDLANYLSGRLSAPEGALELRGEPVDSRDLAAMVASGLAVVVGDREDRVVMTMTMRENMTLAILSRFFRRGVLAKRAELDYTTAAIQSFDVRPTDPSTVVAQLSGGNQQKVAIAKALGSEPAVLVLEEPFRGVDPGGRADIGNMLRAAAAAGTLVVMIDSDVEEIVGMASRVIALRGGQIAREFIGSEITRPLLLEACYG
jgi:ribose transport system ATP-binding protein